MPGDIVFGTDGWRARIAEGYTFDNVRRASQAFADYLTTQGVAARGVVVGYDNRFEAEDFAATAAEVMAGNGIRVYLTDRGTPTPVISFAALHRGAGGAINLTASHNPPQDAGFKVRDGSGAAIAPDDLKLIEARIGPVDKVKSMPFDRAEKQGLVDVWDPSEAYIETRIKPSVDLARLKAAGLKIVVDPMWGVGAGYLPRLIGGGQTELIEIQNTRNPLFPGMARPEPIPPNVNNCLAKVREVGADYGAITDGDADRCGASDEHGVFMNQLQVYAMLALYLLEVRGQRGAIVKTLSTTSMLEKLGQLYGVPVHETGVGFKYIAPKMLETDAMMGGEESGGYAYRGVPERDGILSNLYMIDFIVQTGKKPSELLQMLFDKVGPHYYDRVDLTFPADRRAAILERLKADPPSLAGYKVARVNRMDGYKYELADGGWLLVRFSGTEPLLRVYTEVTDPAAVQPLLAAGRALLGIG